MSHYSQQLQIYSNDLAGILPIVQSRSRWDRWTLPGHGSAKADCGKFFYKGCLDLNAHANSDHKGKIFRRKYARHCNRKACPICYEYWAFREGHAAVRRMAFYKTRFKPIHVIISPGPSDVELPYDDLKDKMYSIADQVGILGGMAIIHPFRSLCRSCQQDKEHCKCHESIGYDWYVSPHFHLVCYGWIKGQEVGAVFEQEGWVVKNLGVRQSVAQTVGYQLSHAGVDQGVPGWCCNHGADIEACRLANEYPGYETPDCKISGAEKPRNTVVWFGDLSYNRLKVPKEAMQDTEGDNCPVCNQKLHEIVFTAYDASTHFDSEKEGEEFFDDPFGWEYLFEPTDRGG